MVPLKKVECVVNKNIYIYIIFFFFLSNKSKKKMSICKQEENVSHIAPLTVSCVRRAQLFEGRLALTQG